MSSHEEQQAAAPSAPPHQDAHNSAPYPSHHPHYPPPGHGYPPHNQWHCPPLPPGHQSQFHAPPHSSSRTTSKTETIGSSPTKPPPTIIHTKAKEQPTEPKVDPMKQDFHFYGAEHTPKLLEECRRKLHSANLPPESTYLSTTLLNATLIYNWEKSSAATRLQYMKMEEGDRKRFMSEDEVASRHCATLTARKRSPKFSHGSSSTVAKEEVEGVGTARSFGLGEVVPQMVGVLAEDGMRKEG